MLNAQGTQGHPPSHYHLFAFDGRFYFKEERDKEDSRIMDEALADLAVKHRQRLSDLERDLKQDAKNKRAAFGQERVRQHLPHRRSLLVESCAVPVRDRQR